MLAAGSAHCQVEAPGAVDCGEVRVHRVETTLFGAVSVTVRVPGPTCPE